MASVEVFQFFSGTNLFSNPINRFAPQTILPNTPDELYCDTPFTFTGEIALPLLDATNGPIYNGKSVLIVLQKNPPPPPGPPVPAPNPLRIVLWDQYGTPLIGVGESLQVYGQSVSVAAFWNASTMTGQWILTRIS